MPRRTRTALIAKGRCRDLASGRASKGDVPVEEKAARIAERTDHRRDYISWGR